MAPVPPTRLTTARLRLRQPVLADAEPIFADYARDPEVLRYLSWRPHADVAETRRYLADRIEAWRTRNAYSYVLQAPDGSRPLGMIELRVEAHRASCGYVLARAHWGRGYMSEALSLLVAWALAQPAVFRVGAFCDADNLASARVMRNAGMAFEGVLRRYLVHPNVSPQPRDCLSFARVRP